MSVGQTFPVLFTTTLAGCPSSLPSPEYHAWSSAPQSPVEHPLLSLPLTTYRRVHPSGDVGRSAIPCSMVGVGQWIHIMPWVADRQADRQRDGESFISAETWLKMTPHPKAACPACLRLKYAKQRENATEQQWL